MSETAAGAKSGWARPTGEPMNQSKPTSRVVLRFAGAVLAGLVLTACGSGDDSEPGTQADDAPPASSPASSPATPASESTGDVTSGDGEDPPPLSCTPPEDDLDYGSGSALLQVTAGPGTGTYELASDGSAWSDGDARLRFADQDGHELFVDVQGAGDCAPDSFVSITVDPEHTFVDSSHRSCVVAVTNVEPTTVEGTLFCTSLAGGGEGVTIDAAATFTVSG